MSQHDQPPPALRIDVFGTIPHGFFGRRGGVSAGAFDSLNVGPGSGDDPALIAENRRRVAAAVLPGGVLISPYQVHGARCVTLDASSDVTVRPEADAFVTATPGVILGILTADCVPVLLADREAGVVGAAHAGWKGAISGITDSTIAAMEALGARRECIVAVLGPCIGRASYEVSMPFLTPFIEEDPDNERFFHDGVRAGHAMFDIAGYVMARIAAHGVTRVESVGIDTCASEDDYFSYRRATLRGENGYGRHISAIALPAA